MLEQKAKEAPIRQDEMIPGPSQDVQSINLAMNEKWDRECTREKK